MKSLKDQACLQIIRRSNLTLRQFVVIINNPSNAQENTLAVSCSDDFSPVWPFLINRDYTPTLLLSRLDIQENEYAQFAKRLARGDVFHYVIVGDSGWNEYRIIDGPRVVYEHDIIQEAEGDTTVIKFDVLGVQPGPGSIGYVVRFYFDGPVKVPMSRPQAFILGPEHTAEDVSELYRRMKLYLAAKFRNVMIPTLTPLLDPFVHRLHHLIEGRAYENIATAEQLDALFDEFLTGGGINMSVFPTVEPGTYRFQEYIVGVTHILDVEKQYLVMYFDVAQLRFA